jgi:hypothetical protein
MGGIFVQKLVAQNYELFSKIQDQNKKIKKPTALTSIAKLIQWYRSPADLIWPEDTF